MKIFRRFFSLFLAVLFVLGAISVIGNVNKVSAYETSDCWPIPDEISGAIVNKQEGWTDSDVGSWYLLWPTDNTSITSPQYYRYYDNKNKPHKGIDINAPYGSAVYAAASGKVVKVISDTSRLPGSVLGKTVIIRHDSVFGGIYTRYEHLSKILVSVGDEPKAGDTIAKSGNTGGVPAHLHFGVDRRISDEGYSRIYINCNKKSGKWNGRLYTKGIFEYTSDKNLAGMPQTVAYNVANACDLYVQTNDTLVRVRDGYYQEKTVVHKIPNKGTVLHAKAFLINDKKNLWYQLDGEYKDENGNDYNGKWVWSGRVEPLSQYSVKYDSNGGTSAPTNQSKLQGRSITISGASPSRKGCNFVGWATTKYGVFNDVDKAANMVAYYPGDTYSSNKNIILYAVWINAETTVTLSKTNVMMCLDDSTKTAQINADISGAVNSTYNVTVSISSTSNTNPKKVTASVSNVSVYTIRLNAGKGMATINLTAKDIGNEIIYVIVRDTTGKIAARASMVVKVTKKYNITYNAAGGSGAPSTQTKMSDSTAYISTNVPTRTGYAFLGWKTPSSGDEAVYGPGDMYKDNADLTLTAKWGPDYYIGSYTENGGKTLVIVGHGDMPCFGLNNYQTSDWFSKCDPSKVENIRFEPSDGGAITSIGSYAFANFKALKSIEIPATVTRIYSYAFYGCSNLKTVTARSDIKAGSYAFSNCTNLTNVCLNNNRSGAKVRTATASEEEQGAIGAFAFENCVNLQSVDLSTVSSVGESAFSGCSSLNDVTLSDNMTNIEDGTFYNCTNLESIDIPDSVKEISDGAFSGCSSLDEVEIPESVEILGDEVFSGCSSITEVEIPETVDTIGSGVFSNCTSLESADLPEDAAFIPDAMFSGCSSLQSIDLPDSALDLGDGTFFGCSSLESIDIPENVCDIGSNTFAYCSSLTTVDIPETAAFVDSFAFAGCSNLSSVELSSMTTEINYGAFADCESLESMDFPESLTTIGIAAFSNCTSLATVNFADSYITIEDEAFAGCTALSDVVIPENAQYVSSSAFADCSSTLSVSCYSTSENYEEIAGNIGTYNTIYPVESISITNEAIELTKGQNYQLNAAFTPSNATNKGLTWRSENEEVATVSDNGLVTAVGSGFATIVATSNDGNHQAQYEVICNIPAEEIVILEDYTNCYVGEEGEMLYSMMPTDPTDIEMVFTSSNENVATVSDGGRLVIVGEGSSLITLSSADGNATTSFTVNATEYIPASNAKLSNNSIELLVDQSCQISGTINPQNSTNKYMYYYSENVDVATVDQGGIITAVSVGTTNIILSVNGGETTATCAVTVTTDNNDYPFTWAENENSGTVTITDCDESITGVITIPNEIDGKPVTEIGAHAFENCTGITAVELPETVRKLGEYSFAGCTALQQINAPESLEYVGEHAFEGCTNLGTVVLPDEYTLTYNANGGSGAPAVQTGNGNITLSIQIPERNGFNFIGWSENETATTAQYSAGQSFNLTQNTTLYAVWEEIVTPASYTVTWVVDGVETTQNYEAGATIQKPADPVKEGYEFKGWTPDVPATMPAEDITFTAVFESIQPDVFTLTYNANGGNNPPASQTGNGNVTISSVVPTREVYNFLGWSENSEDTAAQHTAGQTYNLTKNTVLYAVWEKIPVEPEKYTVTFVADGKVVKTVEYTVGDTSVAEPAVPAKEGYTGKWSSYTLGASNITVNAIYTKINTPEPPVNPTANAKITVKSDEVYKNSKVTVVAKATGVPEGYFLAVYYNGSLVAKGDNKSVTYEMPDLIEENRTVSVKVIDAKGKVQQNGNGKNLSESINISVKTGFFNMLIAFFKKIFGLNKVTIKP